MKTECAYCKKPIIVSDNIVTSVFCNRICFEAYEFESYENDNVFEEFERFEFKTEFEKPCLFLTC